MSSHCSKSLISIPSHPRLTRVYITLHTGLFFPLTSSAAILPNLQLLSCQPPKTNSCFGALTPALPLPRRLFAQISTSLYASFPHFFQAFTDMSSLHHGPLWLPFLLPQPSLSFSLVSFIYFSLVIIISELYILFIC